MYNKVAKKMIENKTNGVKRAMLITEKVLDVFDELKVDVGEANAVLDTMKKMINEEV